ncbi:MAG: hypothetical protein IT458_02045 [Planctomycetes bacterium]|nr:hypothetical protein [Planctomycetota bacterium]
MGWPTANEGLEERIVEIRRRDRRFARNAYFFILDCLDFTMQTLGRDRKTGAERHVGGRELLEGIKEMAAEHFGPMAAAVFQRWGIQRTEDFGEIVFNLIDCGLLTRRPEDSRLDFAGGYDFEQTFAELFRERIATISYPNQG